MDKHNSAEDVKHMFARNISRLRKEAGLSQSELSIKLGLGRNAVSRWEAASLLPRAESLELLASFFNVPKSVFFADGIEQYASYGRMFRLPIVSSLSFDNETHSLTFETIPSYKLISEENLPDEGLFFYIQAACDCLQMRILKGDFVLIRQQDSAANGDICLILINKTLLLRRIVKIGTSLDLYTDYPKWSRMHIENYFTDDETKILYEGSVCSCFQGVDIDTRIRIIGRAVMILANL